MPDVFFKNIEHFLKNEIAPISNELDTDSHLLKKAFDHLIVLDGLKLLIPKECGGLGGGRPEWIRFNILLAQYSGALLFLQAQHQYAVYDLKKLLPNQRVHDLLTHLAQSNQGLAISLAASRNILTVKEANNGFYISGKLRWVTGHQFFPRILFSFSANDIAHYAIIPFDTQQNHQTMLISAPMKLAAFDSTSTVSITLENHYISFNEVFATKPITKNRIEHPSVYNFAGAALAFLNIAAQGKNQHNKQVMQLHQTLLNNYQRYYSDICKNESDPLQLRAQGYQLVQQCANFARIICGADSFLLSHPINRISREIWQYAIAGYSEEQLEAYIDYFDPALDYLDSNIIEK